jgi:hypothetical protein
VLTCSCTLRAGSRPCPFSTRPGPAIKGNGARRTVGVMPVCKRHSSALPVLADRRFRLGLTRKPRLQVLRDSLHIPIPSASGAHVPNACCAPVLGNGHFRLALTGWKSDGASPLTFDPGRPANGQALRGGNWSGGAFFGEVDGVLYLLLEPVSGRVAGQLLADAFDFFIADLDRAAAVVGQACAGLSDGRVARAYWFSGSWHNPPCAGERWRAEKVPHHIVCRPRGRTRFRVHGFVTV